MGEAVGMIVVPKAQATEQGHAKRKRGLWSDRPGDAAKKAEYRSECLSRSKFV